MSRQIATDGYSEASAQLIPLYDAIDTKQLYAPVARFLPAKPCRILDIGAGTGGDAAWLEAQGHEVVAVEPVREFREAGQDLHAKSTVSWIDDRLPDLRILLSAGRKFDCIFLSAVWKHVEEEERIPALANVVALLAPQAA